MYNYDGIYTDLSVILNLLLMLDHVVKNKESHELVKRLLAKTAEMQRQIDRDMPKRNLGDM